MPKPEYRRDDFTPGPCYLPPDAAAPSAPSAAAVFAVGYPLGVALALGFLWITGLL